MAELGLRMPLRCHPPCIMLYDKNPLLSTPIELGMKTVRESKS